MEEVALHEPHRRSRSSSKQASSKPPTISAHRTSQSTPAETSTYIRILDDQSARRGGGRPELPSLESAADVSSRGIEVYLPSPCSSSTPMTPRPPTVVHSWQPPALYTGESTTPAEDNAIVAIRNLASSAENKLGAPHADDDDDCLESATTPTCEDDLFSMINGALARMQSELKDEKAARAAAEEELCAVTRRAEDAEAKAAQRLDMNRAALDEVRTILRCLHDHSLPVVVHTTGVYCRFGSFPGYAFKRILPKDVHITD